MKWWNKRTATELGQQKEWKDLYTGNLSMGTWESKHWKCRSCQKESDDETVFHAMDSDSYNSWDIWFKKNNCTWSYRPMMHELWVITNNLPRSIGHFYHAWVVSAKMTYGPQIKALVCLPFKIFAPLGCHQVDSIFVSSSWKKICSPRHCWGVWCLQSWSECTQWPCRYCRKINTTCNPFISHDKGQWLCATFAHRALAC